MKPKGKPVSEASKERDELVADELGAVVGALDDGLDEDNLVDELLSRRRDVHRDREQRSGSDFGIPVREQC